MYTQILYINTLYNINRVPYAVCTFYMYLLLTVTETGTKYCLPPEHQLRNLKEIY